MYLGRNAPNAPSTCPAVQFHSFRMVPTACPAVRVPAVSVHFSVESKRAGLGEVKSLKNH